MFLRRKFVLSRSLISNSASISLKSGSLYLLHRLLYSFSISSVILKPIINGEFIFFLNFLLCDAKVYKLIRYPGKMSYDQSRQLRSNTALGNLDHIIQTVTSGVIQYVEDRLGISQNYLGIAFHTASSALMASYAFLTSDPEINT